MLVAAAASLASAGVIGCGGSSRSDTSSTSRLVNHAENRTSAPMKASASANFQLHAGLAFGAFHRSIYGPFKAGQLGDTTTSKIELERAARAAQLAYQQLHLAAAAARNSRSGPNLFVPTTLLASRISTLRSQLLIGRITAADFEAANADIAQITSASAAAGVPITERSRPGQ
jgi:hypothetical protein